MNDDVNSEIDNILISENPEDGLQDLVDTGRMREILPELWMQVGFDQGTPHHKLELWEHTKKVVGLVPNSLEIRWAALLHDIGKPAAKFKNSKGHYSYKGHAVISAEMVREIAVRFGWKEEQTEQIIKLVLEHMSDNSPLRKADNLAKR